MGIYSEHDDETDSDQWVDLDDCEVNHETDDALRIQVMGEELWIPKSAVRHDSDVRHREDEGTITVAQWWASREGLA